jgi:hypothetical protein
LGPYPPGEIRQMITKKPEIQRIRDRLISFLQLCYSSKIGIDG